MEEKYIPQDRKQRQRQIVEANRQVIKLINEKLIPLNKLRYEHFKKINNALIVDKSEQKNKTFFQASKIQKLTNINSKQVRNNQRSNSKCELEIVKMIKSQRCSLAWKMPKIVSRKQKNKKSKRKYQMNVTTQSEKENQLQLGDLVKKTEKYLRERRKDLKEIYCKDEFERAKIGLARKKQQQSQIQSIMQRFKINQSLANKKGKKDENIELYLLQDAKLHLLQIKMNRMKIQTNHKKIVNM